MLNVGLTGGIASGKSTVAHLFRERGAEIIDFDELAREVIRPKSPAYEKIVSTFGDEILLSNGEIDRKKLGAIVFQELSKLRQLNDIVHPFVFAEWRKLIEEIKKEKTSKIVISDLPLLFETNSAPLFDVVVLVFIPKEKQLERLMKRDGIPYDRAMLMIASQMPIEEKIPLADVVIDNSFPLEKTEKEVEQVWKDLQRWEAQKDRRSSLSF